jgi:hypothetical protein
MQHFSYVLGAVFGSAALVFAQNPQPTQNQVAVPPVALYSMADVARSLEINDRQRERLDRLTQQTLRDFQPRYNRLGDVAEAERAARTAELNRQYETALLKGSRDILDEKQANRYQQLYYQNGGFYTLNDPDVQKRLNLTDAQRKSLRESIDWSDKQMQEINRTGGKDKERAAQLYRDYRRLYDERFNKTLTAEQLKTWQEMTGEPYTFQPVFVPPRR